MLLFALLEINFNTD